MTRLDNDIVLLIGLYVVSELVQAFEHLPDIVKPLQKSGVKAYDVIHDDVNHRRDLPRNALTRDQIRDLCRKVGFPASSIATAVAVAKAESGGYPDIVGDHGLSFGLWQIHVPSHPEYAGLEEELKDPLQNARAAFQISRGGTRWAPWTTYRSGAYRRYL